MKKITQQEFIEKASEVIAPHLDLSQFVYSGFAEKSLVTCSTHGEFQIRASSILRGDGCPKCGVIKRANAKKMSIQEFLARALDVHGDRYDYSRVHLVSQKTKINIICKDHGEFSQEPHSHLKGKGCKKCANEATGDRSRMPTETLIAKLKEVHGDAYDYGRVGVRIGNKVTVVCPKHGDFTASISNLLNRRSGCPKCGSEKAGRKARYDYARLVSELKETHKGKFEYGEVVYGQGPTFINVNCPEHGWFTQALQDHKKGVGCSMCSQPMRDQETFLSRAKDIHGDRYDYSKAEYVRALKPVTIICRDHGEFDQTPNSHVNDSQGCPQCGRIGPSVGQLEVADFLRNHAEVVVEHRLSNSLKRLDLLLPEHNVAVEFHGLIWHSTKFNRDQKRDFLKHKEAEAQGLRIIHIYSDEWQYRKETVKRLLLSAIGKLPRVAARKTDVVRLSSREAKPFLEANHLQGASNSSVHLGLTLDGSLVACMSFGVARSVRGNTDRTLWELQRYAAACTVVGGAGKLLKHFLKTVPCKSLISYSDTRLFSGNMYKALGFSLVHETRPDYCYVSSGSRWRHHKAQFQRKFLPDKLKSYDPSISEVENCYANGWYQLFDCGKKRWQLDI